MRGSERLRRRENLSRLQILKEKYFKSKRRKD
jgi:hypothetical protein